LRKKQERAYQAERASHELGGLRPDQFQDPKVNVIKVDYEGVIGTFDPEDLLSLLKKSPNQAGSRVVTEAIRILSARR
jgi:hypothetical protein